jgi:competence protein ComEC
MQHSPIDALRLIPLVRVIIPFVLGIYFAKLFPVALLPAFVLLVSCSIILFVLHLFLKNLTRFRALLGICFYLVFAIWGFVVTGIQLHRSIPLVDNTKYRFVATVCDIPYVKGKTVKTVLSISQFYDGSRWLNRSSKVLAGFSNDSVSRSLQMGDIIVANAYTAPIEDFKTNGRFSYRSFMAGKQIYNRMYIPRYWWKIVKRSDWSILGYSVNIRNTVDSLYKQCGFPSEEQTVLSALMLGVRTEMSPELLTAYSSTGAMHILAVSGLHVGILYLIMSWMLFFIRGRILSIIKALIIVAAIWFYAFMTGFSPSIERAAIMFSLMAIVRQLQLSYSIYNLLAATALISLLSNPLELFDIGFQLSYLAIIGIVYFSKKFNALFMPENKWVGKLWELLTVSLAAQILTLPLTMYYFGQIPLYFLLTNLIAIPVSFIVMILGIVIIPCMYISKSLSLFIAYFLNKSVWLQNASIKLIASLPFSSIHCCIPLWVTMFLFCIIACVMVFIELKRFNLRIWL